MLSTKASQQLSEYKTRARAAIRQAFETDWMIPIVSGSFTIQTKDAKLVRFRPNIIQLLLLKKLHELRTAGIPVRLLVPKARQHGISTLSCAMAYSNAAFRFNRSCLICADSYEKSVPLFDKSKLMHSSIDPAIRTETGRSNSQELIFTETKSVMRVTTSGSEDIGRSFTYQFAHFSEVAFFKNAEKVMLGVMQSIPDIADTLAIFESTGNGQSGWFYDECMAAKNGKGNKQLWFIPWWQNPEYMKVLPNDYILVPQDGGQWGDEISQMKAYSLSNEQLYWRRNYIDNYCGRDLFKFMQEYPACIEDAFLASGFPVFNQLILDKIERLMCNIPIKEAIFLDNKIHWTTGGWLKFWALPERTHTHRYCIFMDTGGNWSGADYYSAHVYDRLKKEVVCVMHEHFKPYQAAYYLFILGTFYDTAMVCIEVNKQKSETAENGLAVIDDILEKYKYPANALYMRETYNDLTKQVEEKFGFHTTSETKQLLINRGFQYIDYESDVIKVNDKNTVQELKTFVVLNTDGKSTYGASEKCHDDKVISFLGALFIADEMPPVRLRPVKVKTKKNYNTENITDLIGRYQ